MVDQVATDSGLRMVERATTGMYAHTQAGQHFEVLLPQRIEGDPQTLSETLTALLCHGRIVGAR